jgi:hypothetical protein
VDQLRAITAAVPLIACASSRYRSTLLLLEQTGAEDISSSGEKTGETYATVAPDRTRL